MKPYRGILYTYRWPYGISTSPDDPNTLTHKSADMNESPRDPLYSPVKGGELLLFCKEEEFISKLICLFSFSTLIY